MTRGLFALAVYFEGKLKKQLIRTSLTGVGHYVLLFLGEHARLRAEIRRNSPSQAGLGQRRRRPVRRRTNETVWREINFSVARSIDLLHRRTAPLLNYRVNQFSLLLINWSVRSLLAVLAPIITRLIQLEFTAFTRVNCWRVYNMIACYCRLSTNSC